MVLTGGKNMKLGINGFGRIGKLSVWHHVGRKYFDEIVVNIGREAGSSLEDIAHYVERDSTYGSLKGFLHGYRSQSVVQALNEKNSCMTNQSPRTTTAGTQTTRMNHPRKISVITRARGQRTT